MADQTIEDRFAYYWLQAERARFEAGRAEDDRNRHAFLQIARAWATLAKSLNTLRRRGPQHDP